MLERHRVLIIDGNSVNLRSLALGMEIEGFDVLGAASPADALGTLGEVDVDVVLVELMQRGGMSGLQLARELNRSRPYLPVVLMSRHAVSEGQLLRSDCGAAGFVTMPCPLSSLAQFLRSKVVAYRSPESSVRRARARLEDRRSARMAAADTGTGDE